MAESGAEPARARAVAVWRAGLAAADPTAAVLRALDPGVRARLVPGPGGRLVLVAIGKAARSMAAAVLAEGRPKGGGPKEGGLEPRGPAGEGLRPAEVLVVTDAGNARPLAGAEVLAAGHPLPDAGGLAAAARLEALVRGLGAADRLLVLVSGGGSAMLPAPVAGLGLDDKIAVNRLLLGSGADIVETNLVRQALSRLKGGGLARAAAPAPVVALILSDVPGDDLRAIASGPTVAPIGDRAAAAAALRARGLWHELPEAVRRHLSAPEEAPADGPAATAAAENRLIGSNALSVAAMVGAGARAAALPLEGDVAEAAAAVLQAARALPPGAALAFGGETVVRLRGGGRGGRNQELALRVALLAEAEAGRTGGRTGGLAPGWAFLAAGSDGRDGPTEAAGGLVDAGTPGRIRAAGIDPAAALAENDSNPALAAAGDLFVTGATGTNVADLAVFVAGGASGGGGGGDS